LVALISSSRNSLRVRLSEPLPFSDLDIVCLYY
jgi:hypothetical protein